MTPAHWPSSESDAGHEPVLVDEVVSLLRPRAGGTYVDCTLGLGGHTRALVVAGAGRVIGIDRDAHAIDVARGHLADAAGAVTFVHDDYRRLGAVLSAQGIAAVDGVLADLGVSSMQLDDPGRGFSFRQPGPLDMRMDRTRGATLAERLAEVDERALADVIFQYGEERRARQVARAVISARDRGALADTAALAGVVRRAVGAHGWQRLDPATRTFQALRIWVNDELTGLEGFIDAAWHALRQGGRIAIIAFQSLEDRVVKHTFRRLASAGGQLVTKRPIVASEAERARNPRARSARLRGLERVA
ncbi:MAG: 16S rRNA (cytosine(1402)-N(4))-methyltransferase RsmH [Acidobacteria bacterium]|nr:16S rRNA (cytosine(1402)-N(4))-methyltransferase RsmH [Acidobacteriota bacterium]